MRFRIQRYNPDQDAGPHFQDYDVQMGPADRMLLDALVRIKTLDDTLSLRRSCREGVCGSDAMNINGKNGLACMTKLTDLKEPVVIRPLPGLPVVRDLIVDMTQFFAQYHSVKPYVINDEPAAGARAAAVARAIARSWTACTSASCARAARPPARASGGTRTSSSARRGCCRPTASSPTAATRRPTTRLDNLEDPYRLFRCHTIMNCVDVCPKGLNPALAIAKIREMLARRAVWGGAMDARAVQRLRWRSRRGLLELDLVLDRYWAGAGMRMTTGEAEAMERLLALGDNDLLDLVMGRAEAPDAHLRALLEQLRAA